MSPLTSSPSSVAASPASRRAAAQNVATEVPTMHPEPVISPSNLWPFEQRITTLPSET